MVLGSNGRRSRRHGNENQDLPQIKEVVKRRHQENKAGSWKRDKEEMELGRGCQGKG
jgi:hypothetical protein